MLTIVNFLTYHNGSIQLCVEAPLPQHSCVGVSLRTD